MIPQSRNSRLPPVTPIVNADDSERFRNLLIFRNPWISVTGPTDAEGRYRTPWRSARTLLGLNP